MGDQLGEWAAVTEVEIYPEPDVEENGGPYRARLRWEKEDDVRADGHEVEIGPVHFITFATGRTRPEGTGAMRWEDPRGAPVSLYQQPERKVGLVVGDLEDAPPTHLPLDAGDEEADTATSDGDEVEPVCIGCRRETRGHESTAGREITEAVGVDFTGRQEDWYYLEPPATEVCDDCLEKWCEAARGLAPEQVPCLRDDHEAHEVHLTALTRYPQGGPEPEAFRRLCVPFTLRDWLNWFRIDPSRPAKRARLTCTGCERTEIVNRVTTKRDREDLTGRPEGWHDTFETGALQEPQPYIGVCPSCWADWSSAARKLAPRQVPCLDENHEPHEVDPGTVARHLDGDRRPAHVFHRACIPADPPTWANLVGFDPADAGSRVED